MTENARREMLNLPSFVTECSLIYLPQLGYLLTIPAELFADNSDYLIDDLDFLFVANEFAHYKSRITREMDDTIGDIKFEIMGINNHSIDAEVNVILALQEGVKPHLSTLYEVIDILAAFDW
ncbi:MutS protein 5 [Thelohanellus kitauei]|uniref:MutS protein 5 n=1 Tax=Thelohanellus kitauei TaxID=669202 RepID=A0A0C2MWG2_THEKT|nr:MutS protein 5 [Thelohanellus kitauei]